MYVLSTEKKLAVLSAMVEGNSIRATERMTDVHRDTIMRLVLRVGENCKRLMNERMRNLACANIQADEIWTFVGKKDKRVRQEDDKRKIGDQYVFVAMDADSKLVPCFYVGKRNWVSTWNFVQDLQGRLRTRVQLTTDGFRPYLYAVEDHFGDNVDYAMLVKTYAESGGGPERRYSPGEFVNARPIPISGEPKPWLVSTSFVERQNLTMRMQMRRFTRLTNAFSKRLENLKAACALHFCHYNFCRVHSSLRVTPAMAAGVTQEIWPLTSLLA